MVTFDRSYPTAPTACSKDPSCTVLVETYTEAGPIVLYSIWALALLSWISFAAFRNRFSTRSFAKHSRARAGKRAGHIGTPKSEDIELNELLESQLSGVNCSFASSSASSSSSNSRQQIVVQVDEDEAAESANMVLRGYASHPLGEIAYGFVLIVTALWPLLVLIIIVGYYQGCQWNGIDALCFYGSYFIFGDYNANNRVFFFVWLFSSAWFAAMLVFGSRVRNWCRVPAHLSHAEFLWVWIRDADVSMTSGSELRIVALVRELREKFLSKFDRHGRCETVRVCCTTASRTPFFVHEGSRYMWQPAARRFEKPFDKVSHATYRQLHARGNHPNAGLTDAEAASKIDALGPNQVEFVPSTLPQLICAELANWFYLYQWVCYTVWVYFSYLVVGVLMTLIVVISTALSILVTWRSEHAIAALTHHQSRVRVLRNGVWTNVDSSLLVPGDVVKLAKGDMSCDMVLTKGSVLVNESNLTGESAPVYKVACSSTSNTRPSSVSRKHTLLSSTSVLQVDGDATAVVFTTGMNTSKGELLSSILYPIKFIFKYDEELTVVSIMLLGFAAVCFGLSIYLQSVNGSTSTPYTKVWYGVFTVSQILSPLITVALKVGQIRSSARLNQQDIFCINPSRIAIAGKVRVLLMDKTGTMTKSGLDLVGVQPVLESSSSSSSSYREQAQWASTALVSPEHAEGLLSKAMASCHTLTEYDGALVGNEVEAQMFSSQVGYRMQDNDNEDDVKIVITKDNVSELICLQRFEFDHARQTSSVIVMDSETDTSYAFVKGSFERIASLCDEASLPHDFEAVAHRHALAGGYVLAIAMKRVVAAASDHLSRDDVEANLQLLGLIVFLNEVKPDTPDALREARAGHVRGVMVTGDNVHTAEYVAKHSGLIDRHAPVWHAELAAAADDGLDEEQLPDNKSSHHHTVVWRRCNGALTTLSTEALLLHPEVRTDKAELIVPSGKVFSALIEADDLHLVLRHVRIYARMEPLHKVEVVRAHRARGLVVAMVGDGGNDCGALRAAHVGVALSDADASLVSPFTAKQKRMTDVITVLREGRAALHTSFANYKFLITYGQLFALVKLLSFYYGSIMALLKYIFIDCVALIMLGYACTMSQPRACLGTRRPTSGLLSSTTIASVLGLHCINLLVIISALALMSADPNYIRWPAANAEGAVWWLLGDNWESSVLFFTFFPQLITSAVTFSFGASFRRNVLTNVWLMGSWLVLFVLSACLLLSPASEGFTAPFHIASEAFNSVGTVSKIWAAYNGGNAAKTSPGMSAGLRLKLWILVNAGLLLTFLWQRLVVDGPIAQYIRHKFPSHRPKHKI